ncbi:MAG: F0F1 ATP synthase subunit B [Eubacteriales bacterium]|nr:F0F1 ATP synthase subunit B [Eubacteriales bacterium]
MEPRLFNLDFQLLADSMLTIIAVFVLFLALSYFLFNPARKFLQGRQEKIAGELENAKTKEEEAVKLKEEYEAKLSGIEKEADEILADARKKALLNETRIIAEAKEEAARIIARANVEAELEKKKAADEVKREMIAVAAAMAGKIVGASMDESKQNALIDETLQEIGESTWLS